MTHKKVIILGLKLDEWKNKSCTAHFGMGTDWATLYDIESKIESQGHATELLIEAKKFYENRGKCFGGDIALNDRMRSIYKRLKINEYNQ